MIVITTILKYKPTKFQENVDWESLFKQMSFISVCVRQPVHVQDNHSFLTMSTCECAGAAFPSSALIQTEGIFKKLTPTTNIVQIDTQSLTNIFEFLLETVA